MTNINGLHVGMLTPEELRWFEAEIKAGRAYRSYEGAGGLIGLAKVKLIPTNSDQR
jgi:hypothetical protein